MARSWGFYSLKRALLGVMSPRGLRGVMMGGFVEGGGWNSRSWVLVNYLVLLLSGDFGFIGIIL